MINNDKRVIIGLSGGVDSAVAAALLIDRGYEVMGVSLSMWKAGELNDQAKEDQYRDAQAVANHLKIPWSLVDMQAPFKQKVISYYLESLGKGMTPNPCIVCNKNIKWRSLLEIADQQNAAYISTGHYARLVRTDTVELHKAIHQAKDQSYFLSILGQPELSRSIFPLGEYTKTDTRRIAKEKGLPVAERPESQDLCFLGDLNQDEFIDQYAPQLLEKGEIVHQDGRVLGEHLGLAGYTIGQRKGIKIANSAALYVLEKDLIHNRVIVGEKELLGTSRLIAADVNWISGHLCSDEFKAMVKIRYRAAEREATIIRRPENKLEVLFKEEIRDITPGQAMVIYQGDNCLGMGFIE
jgi:tRNA-specific 2-thiouridylase